MMILVIKLENIHHKEVEISFTGNRYAPVFKIKVGFREKLELFEIVQQNKNVTKSFPLKIMFEYIFVQTFKLLINLSLKWSIKNCFE